MYRELNPDLIKVGLKTKSDFDTHYIENGKRENRSFCIYQKYPDFSPIQYKINYPDLQKLNNQQLEWHWIFHGRKEKRSYLPYKYSIVDTKHIKEDFIPESKDEVLNDNRKIFNTPKEYLDATSDVIRESIQSIREKWVSDGIIGPPISIKEIDIDNTSNKKTNVSVKEPLQIEGLKTIRDLVKESIQKEISEQLKSIKKETELSQEIIEKHNSKSITDIVYESINMEMDSKIKQKESSREKTKKEEKEVQKEFSREKTKTEEKELQKEFSREKTKQEVQKESNNENKIVIGDIDVFQKAKNSNHMTNMYSSDLNNLGISHIYISNDLKHLERICELYNLKKKYRQSEPILMFGLYNADDYRVLNSHKSTIYIMWGGTDEQMISPKTLELLLVSKHIHHIAISKDIEKRLLTRGLDRVTYINLDLTNYLVFKPIEKKGHKIFIYNGYNKGQEDKYGKHIYEEVMNKLPEYDYILSNELGGIKNEKMFDVYKQCFIGLRLTNYDGNANMVGELKAMDIPVIHNLSDYGIKWSNAKDVINIIKTYRKKGTNIDMYNLNQLDNDDLEIIKENIENFKESISEYRNILFICSDYPGYGGAATNCYRLQKYFKKDHNVCSIYYNFYGDKNVKIESNPEYCIVDEAKIEIMLKSLRFKPDLIILKSFVNTVNVKSLFSCPVYYLIPGIFLNTLNKYYYNIKSRNEMDTFINKSVIKQIINSDKSYCNSSHTRALLKKYYNIPTQIFFSSFIDEYDNEIIEDPDFDKRKYDFGIVCSNFNRPIKNITTSIKALKNKKNVILIGNDSKKYMHPGFTCIESVPTTEMKDYYKQIKYIVQDSYYESCSNVKIEALFNGCKVIQSDDKVIIGDNKIVNKNTGNALTILDKKDIYIVDKYKKEEYQNICKKIDYFNTLNIKLNYLLLSTKTELLNDYNHRIRIQDYTKKYQIKNIMKKWLKNNVEQVLYVKELETSLSSLINIFRDKHILNNTLLEQVMAKKIKVFINFKSLHIPYGGGNQFTINLVEYLNKIENIKVTYDLEDEIDIYFIIDIRKGPFKKYSFDEIYNHKKQNGGVIIYRINDCSITRLKCNLETTILENIDKIDHFVFNSTFIHDYYVDKYDKFMDKQRTIIYNTANSEYFYPKPRLRPEEAGRDTDTSLLDADTSTKKLRIVTHHWSDNVNKGYDIYYKLYQYCKKRDDIELLVIGRKFADGFIDAPEVKGPYKGKELGDMLRECDIYISASKYDSCPMHILEGISCGLPILYLDHPGGVKDICELGDNKIGESFNTIEECIEKINLIKTNYGLYYNNIVKNIDQYNSNQCYSDYTKIFLLSKNSK
jgi:hypothetical protein